MTDDLGPDPCEDPAWRAMMADTLGARVIAERPRVKGEPWSVPSEADLITHMVTMHRLPAALPGRRELTALPTAELSAGHDRLHTMGRIAVPHHHAPPE